MPTLTLVAERTPIKAYELTTPAVSIGRGEDMDIDNVSVSRRQARIQLAGDGRWIVEDLSSANGTFLNGERLAAPTPLTRGDEISFGKFSLFFDRVMKLALQEREVGVKPELPRPSETFHM